MSSGTTQTQWMRFAIAAMVATALVESTACNAISGANEIDFTGATTTSPGDGGITAVDQGCKDSTGVVVGIRVWSDAWINGFVPQCANFQDDGHTGDAYLAEPVVGDTAGTPVDQFCDRPNDVVSLKYNFDADHLYQIQLGCATPEIWKSTSPMVEQWLASAGSMTVGPSQQEEPCPDGWARSHMTINVNEDDQSIRSIGSFDSSHDCSPMP